MANSSSPNEVSRASLERNAVPPQINSTLSLVAGRLIDQVLQVWPSNHVHEYLLASDQRRQVWHCWLGSQRDIVNPEQAHQFLSRTKSLDILTDASGCCPSGLISALGKLGAQARRKEFYAALFGVLKRGGPLARHVQHLKQISDETIFALAAINDHLPSDRLLKVVLRGAKPDQFPEVTWVIRRLCGSLGEGVVEREICSGGNPSNAMVDRSVAVPRTTIHRGS